MRSKPWGFRPKSTLIRSGGCEKGQGSKPISEEPGAPMIKADVESTPEAEYTHISGGQSSSEPTVGTRAPGFGGQGSTWKL